MKKYPKIKTIGEPKTKGITQKGKLYITEKMDGANFRFKPKKGMILYGSRNVKGLNKNRNQFRKAIDYISDNVDSDELIELLENEYGHYDFTFFGECMTKHSLNYDWENLPGFIGFDIYNEKKDYFLDFEEVQKIYKEFNIPTVPIVDAIDISEGKPKISEDLIPESKYRDGIAEGIVIKNYDTQKFAKLRSEEFREENKKNFGGKSNYVETDTDKFLDKYCTEHRIEKMIYKLRDEGHDIEMPLMEQLPKRVWKDIWEENLNDIIFSNKEIDMSEARSKLSSKCAKILKNMIIKEGV
ncbi:MAG: RNA ligase family protein [Promethearchaeota archaeon]